MCHSIGECFNSLNYLKIERQDSKSHKSEWTLTEMRPYSVYTFKDTGEKTCHCQCDILRLVFLQ